MENQCPVCHAFIFGMSVSEHIRSTHTAEEMLAYKNMKREAAQERHEKRKEQRRQINRERYKPNPRRDSFVSACEEKGIKIWNRIPDNNYKKLCNETRAWKFKELARFYSVHVPELYDAFAVDEENASAERIKIKGPRGLKGKGLLRSSYTKVNSNARLGNTMANTVKLELQIFQ